MCKPITCRIHNIYIVHNMHYMQSAPYMYTIDYTNTIQFVHTYYTSRVIYIYRGGVYGGGWRRGQDEFWVFRQGFWFLISTDSVIFRSATSLHIFSMEILNEVELTLLD